MNNEIKLTLDPNAGLSAAAAPAPEAAPAPQAPAAVNGVRKAWDRKIWSLGSVGILQTLSLLEAT